MNTRYNLRSRNVTFPETTTPVSDTRSLPFVDSDVLDVAKILYNLRSGKYGANYSNAASKYSMNEEEHTPVEVVVEEKAPAADDEDWIDEKPDEDIVREACSCISRRLDPPQRFFDLLHMYDGGELSDDFVAWMYSIPPIRRCMENKAYRRSQASRQRKNRERIEASARRHPLERTERRLGFSTNLVNTPPLNFSKDGPRPRRINTYNLRSLNAVTTVGKSSTPAPSVVHTHRYNTRSTTNGTRNE